jgi:hypothetical protein
MDLGACEGGSEGSGEDGEGGGDDEDGGGRSIVEIDVSGKVKKDRGSTTARRETSEEGRG